MSILISQIHIYSIFFSIPFKFIYCDFDYLFVQCFQQFLGLKNNFHSLLGINNLQLKLECRSLLPLPLCYICVVYYTYKHYTYIYKHYRCIMIPFAFLLLCYSCVIYYIYKHKASQQCYSFCFQLSSLKFQLSV